ncbi:hypothetical protein UFOVP1659_13 [uncultured Caudovirales phage]|uniref:Uncharacterized protein n=1 Tax=uncultured Caudovirales phage TaxID=2100421 RepID=A0A6J5T5X9_9CAUD|nr:hypothetical protein UFOVP1056_16 [uncultured Caudovirales phage]CAB4222254.1 hypothetical protein UFOVP1659_13 [uncultured Caudovirales phage]
MGSKSASLSVNIVADASQARKGFKDAQDAGAAMAAALTKAADKVETSLATTTAIAKKLADQLGPGFSATKIDKIATDFQRAGLSVEDVEKNIDSLTAGVKRLEGVSGTMDNDLTTGMRNVASETDKTRSVMANFTGNAVQELPGVAGQFGPLNMAVGQFAEGLAEGEINMKNLALTAGGLAVASFVLSKIADNAKAVAAVKAFNKSEVDAYATALSEADSRIQGIAQRLRDAGKIKFTFDWKYGQGVADASGLLAQLGLDVEKISVLVAGGKPKIQQWADAMLNSGANADKVALAVMALNDQVAFVETAETQNIATMALFGKQTEDMTTKTARMADEIKTAADASWAMDDAYKSLIGLGPDIESAYRDITKAAEDFQATQSPENFAAWIAAADTATGAWVTGQEELDKLNGKTWTATQDTYGHVIALQALAGEYEPGSKLRQGVDGLIAQYAALLSLQELVTNQGRPGAHIGGDRYQELRTGYTTAVANLPTYTPQLPGNANGTMNAAAGWTWVGERGPELVNFGGGESVMPAGRSASSATSSTGPVNVTVNMPAGSNGDDVVRTLQRWVRQNGPVPLATTTLVTA